MEFVSSHWKPFNAIGSMSKFGEVSDLNLCDRGKQWNWLLQIISYGFLHLFFSNDSVLQNSNPSSPL